VLKPSEEAPLSAIHLARCPVDAGLPAGVLNVVVGRGADADAGAELLTRPEVRAISFTGSAEVGRRVREAATAVGKRVQLELGGQNPMVVMGDADLGRAVEAAYAGAFLAAGQKCTATRRIFVQQDVFTTDGQLASGSYKVLADTERVFGFQHVALVIDEKKLDELGGSDFMRIINDVNERLTTSAMIQMNRDVELDRQDPSVVAERFLRTAGLLGGAA
jgi:delta 1-pyrroline-5-carboxylate dehydrogenase